LRAAATTTKHRFPQHISLTTTVRFLATKKVKVHTSSAKSKNNEKMIHVPDVAKEKEIAEMQQQVRHHHQYGEYQQALELANIVLSETEDHFGKDHPATASAYNNVGLMQKLLGNYKEARLHYHQALRSYGLILGKDHASYAAALHNLGALQRTQVALDEELTAMERLTLTEEAVEFLEEAWQIRKVELGFEHAHTVASRSALGSTIASQLLAIQTQQAQKKEPFKPSKMTLQRWEVAEQHLRSSLETATTNPRGTQIEESKSAYRNITTLSAAAAAQSLAVILKMRAVLQSPIDEDSLAEAKQLYEQALKVRTELLYDAHPDTVSTKFSLAELIAMNDEERANAMRQEIMDAYNVTEVQDENKEG
jgi:tetratricopeptide (TPR) repeat protein